MRLSQPPAAQWRPGDTPSEVHGADHNPGWQGYPEESAPAALATTVGTGRLLPTGFTRVGRALQVLLGLCGVGSLATIAFEGWGLAMLRQAAAGDFAALDLYGRLGAYVGGSSAALTAVTGVLWLAWQHRLATAVPRWTLSRSPRWQVASWFLPVVNLWFPFQDVTDVRRAVLPESAAQPTPLLYRLWWGSWVGSSLVTWLTSAFAQGETTIASMTQSAAATIVGEALSAGSAACAILVVGDLTLRCVQARDEAVEQATLR